MDSTNFVDLHYDEPSTPTERALESLRMELALLVSQNTRKNFESHRWFILCCILSVLIFGLSVSFAIFTTKYISFV